ncbi:MAG TPA: class I SAM-dependent methyltransferase [Solirubrobacteraceae bacterium]
MPGAPPDMLDELLEVRGRDVLDIGCGEGGLVRRLVAEGARPVGLDPLRGALDRARAHADAGPRAHYVEGVAEALPFEDASFDVVIFFNSLHHVPVGSMDAALAEAARVLRPDGVLFVQEPKAEGSAFELLRPVDDETEVRGAAQSALARARRALFDRRDSREAVLEVRHADFETLRARTTGVDPARGPAFREHEAALRSTFERLGRPVERGGLVFDQPFSVDVLGLRGAGA